MGDKGEGGVQNLKKGVTSFMDDPKINLKNVSVRENNSAFLIINQSV